MIHQKHIFFSLRLSEVNGVSFEIGVNKLFFYDSEKSIGNVTKRRYKLHHTEYMQKVAPSTIPAAI